MRERLLTNLKKAFSNKLVNYYCYLVILCAYVETENSDINKASDGSGHYSGVLWDVSGPQPKTFTLCSAGSGS